MLSQKLIKKHSFSKPHNISKNSTMGAQGLNLDDLLVPFGHHLSSNFMTHPNLLNCNKHCVKIQLLPFQASHFGIENRLKGNVSSRHHPGPNFSSFYRIVNTKRRLLDPFGIQLGPKWRPKSAKWRQKTLKKHRCAILLRVLEPSFFPNRPRFTFSGFVVDFWPIWDRFFVIWIDLLMDSLLFWNTLF